MDPREMARTRARLQAAVRAFLTRRGFEEVETPCLVPSPGTETHIDAFRTTLRLPEGDAAPRELWLHPSPELAMKRLLSRGFHRIFQLARVFRDGEVTPTHNPEFTLLELYRAGTDYRGIMADLEELVAEGARAILGSTRVPWRGGVVELAPPFRRVTVAEAFLAEGIDLAACDGDVEPLRRQLVERGFRPAPGDGYDDLFFRVFLERVEPRLAAGPPAYVVDWPAPMAALARLRPEDPRWAERFELYAGGLELANGFSELTDPVEQRARFEREQARRAAASRARHPIDEAFLAELGHMPPAGGVALGVDRLLMLLTGATRIEDVLLFPVRGMLGDVR